MAGRSALGSAETDQQLQIVGILAKKVGNMVDVRGIGPALAAEAGGDCRPGPQNGQDYKPDCQPHPHRTSYAIGYHVTHTVAPW